MYKGFNIFPPHATDFYKTGHIKQYPAETRFVYSNFTCRADKLAKVLGDVGGVRPFDHKTVFFGLQGVIQWLLIDSWKSEFFNRPWDSVVSKYKRRMDSSLGKDAVDVSHIKALWDLGYLPVLIKALPEGSRVDIRCPLFTIQNTHPDFYWVTNYLETQISAEIWKPITTATTAYEYRRLFSHYADVTGAPREFVQWQGHDFSYRGMSGIHDATSNGAAHLTCFTGTDTISAIDYLEEYYDANDGSIVGGSVPATEHSVMCMGGSDDEQETFRRLIMDTYPSGIVSIVSDTWDFWEVITGFTRKLKKEILNRDGKVVFRPDSGDPVKIICGDSTAPVDSPEYCGAVECLWQVFGGTKTSKGYKVLDPHVGLIYGDSITLERARTILQLLEAKGFASNNIVFGIGSFTYQYVTRDTFGSAIKATAGIVGSEFRELYKDPKTDDGTKKSLRGFIRVEKEDGKFIVYDRQTEEQEAAGLLAPVFMDGVLLRRQTLDNIRNLINEGK